MKKLILIILTLPLSILFWRSSDAQQQRPDLVDAAIFLLTRKENVPVSEGRYQLQKEEATYPTYISPRTEFVYMRQAGHCRVRLYYLRMNQQIGHNSATVGLGHSAEIVEFDLSALGESLQEDYYRGAGAVATTKVGPSFCSVFLPKNYSPVYPAVFANWGGQFFPNGSSNETKSTPFGNPRFFAQSSFVTKEQAGFTGIWPHGTDLRILNLAIGQAKEAITQRLDELVSSVEKLEHDAQACTAILPFPGAAVELRDGRAIFALQASSVRTTREELQRLASARRFLKDKFGCASAEEPKKPF